MRTMLLNNILAVFEVFKVLGKVLKDAFLVLFLLRKGKEKEELKLKKKEVLDAKKANLLINHISNLDDDTLNDGLRTSNKHKKQ